MIVTTQTIKRLAVGTPCKLIKSGQVCGEIRGHIVASGKKKVFVSESGTTYDIKDRPGWVWDKEPTLSESKRIAIQARELPVNHARSGGDRHGQK